MTPTERHDTRRRYEQGSLERKSKRTGLPVNQIRHPKHASKKGKK